MISHFLYNFLFFFSNIGFLSLLEKFERRCLYVIRITFWSVLAAIIRKNSDKRPWIENREGFAAHSSTWPRGAESVYIYIYIYIMRGKRDATTFPNKPVSWIASLFRGLMKEYSCDYRLHTRKIYIIRG